MYEIKERGQKTRKRERESEKEEEKESWKVVRFCTSEFLAADWPFYYVAIKQHGAQRGSFDPFA
jgi:hypothetical protein